jgi:hypothetical protein
MFFDFELNKNLSLEDQGNLFIKQTKKINNTNNGIEWATQYFS